MKRFLFSIFALAIVLGASGSANATSFSYDFSTFGFANGQILEGMTLDLATFTSETGDLRYYSDYGAGIGTGYQWGAAADTYINFSAPVENLTFRAGDGGGDLDAFEVTLYAFGTNLLIGTWATPQFDGTIGPPWYVLNIPASNVGRVVFDPGNSGILPGIKELQGGLVITDFSYDSSSSVPEPASLLLLGVGLGGLVLAVRLKKR